MVFSLKRFVDTKYSCYEYINIKDEVDKFKKKNPDKDPIVIFDFMNTVTMLFEYRMEVYCGGRFTECTRRALQICQKFKDLGVKMVFYLDGPIKKDKLPKWIRAVTEKYKFHQQIIDIIKNKKELDLHDTGEILSTYFDNFLRVVKEYGTVLISLENECDKDIAAYAKNNNILAIFSSDTDFLIMPGDWNIWSPRELNIDKFTTRNWNKCNLRKSLKLNENQMPVFATLCGNDFVHYDMVKHLREILPKGNYPLVVADFVNRHFPNGCPLSEEDFDKLADIIYDSDEKKFDMDYVKSKIRTSLDFYTNINYEVPDIEPFWLKEHIEETRSTILYILLNNIPFTIKQNYIDLSKIDVRPYCDLVIPIIRRQMGVVFYNKRNEDVKQTIYYKPSHLEPPGEYEIKPIYPEEEIPEIYDIVIRGSLKNIVSDKKRFEILSWIISRGRKKLNPTVLQEISNTIFFLPALILNYLVKLNQITVDEADVVLLASYEAGTEQYEKIQTIEPPETLMERPVWISFVFTHLMYHFLNSITVCGLLVYSKKSTFDGYIFHKMYPIFLSKTREEKEKHLKQIEKYRIYT